MASLGELFIELGVVGDTKELDKALNTMKETIKAVDKQIQQSQRLRRYREELAKATTKSEKNAIKNEFALEVKKNKLLEQANATQKNIDANKELANNVAGVVKGITAFVGAVALAVAGLNRLTSQLVESNQAFLNLTRTSDISLNTFQKWDSVGKMLGVQNAADQVAGLNERLFELMLTGQGARGFQLAGINPMGQDANGVLEQIRNRISGLSDTSASYLLKEMGLDPQMLHLLRMSREEFEALNAEMARYRLTPEQRASIQQMNIQLQIAAQKLQYLKDRAILAIMPAWTKLVSSFSRVAILIAKVTKSIGNFIVKWRSLIVIAGVAIGKFTKIGEIFTKFNTGLSTAIAKIPVLGKVMAGLGGIFSKWFGWLTAIFLLLDDFAVYQEGGKSVLGEFLEWGKQQGNDYGEIAATWKEDRKQGFKDILIKLITTLDNFVKEIARWLSIITGIPFDKGVEAWSNFVSRGAINKAQNYDYSHGRNENLSYNPNMLLSPAAQSRIINNNNTTTASTNTSNVVNQNIQIQTEQPAQSIQQELAFAQSVFVYG